MNRTVLLALSTGTVIAVIVTLLLVLAVGMVALAVWLIRRTRRDVVALGPLEVMADRAWRRGDEDRRGELLADARPEGARPPAPMLDEPGDEEADPEESEGADDSAEPDAPGEPDGETTEATPPQDAPIEVEVLHRYDPNDG